MNGQIRADLAAAANTVEGITAHPYYVQGTKPGHTFVRLERIDYENTFGRSYEHPRWNVVVTLSQDMELAERFVDDTLPLLVEALRPHLTITSAALQRVDFPGVGILPCAFITGHREAD